MKNVQPLSPEANLAGALHHPHIVRILQIGVAPMGEVAYIAMELVEGESLADLLSQRGRLRPEETANVLEPIARALAYAHDQGVIHRDVKPGNILLRSASPGASGSVQLESLDHPVVPLLSDFGIARALDAPELTSAGRTVGTPAYMAPEQCAGSRGVDGRADIYALGAVLYRTITGRLPFNGTTTQILHAHVYEALIIDDSVLRILSPLMVEVLQRCMAKQPEDRYATAAELADALALAAGRLPPRAGAALGETTATLTLATLPRVSELPGAAAATVLVAGVPTTETTAANPAPSRLLRGQLRNSLHRPGHFPPCADSGDHRSAAASATHGQPPRTAELARDCACHRDWRCRPGNWANLWHPRSRSFESFGGGATPTAGAVSLLSPTPVLLPGVAVTNTAVTSPTAAPLATAIATIPVITVIAPTPIPSSTPPPPTVTPPPPTETPVPTPIATATPSPTLTPTPTSTARNANANSHWP